MLDFGRFNDGSVYLTVELFFFVSRGILSKGVILGEVLSFSAFPRALWQARDRLRRPSVFPRGKPLEAAELKG